MDRVTEIHERDSREHKFGPAMQALSTMQQRFVVAMLESGGLNYTRAAREAGYADNPKNSKQISVVGHNLAHDERIQEAIKEEASRRMNAGVFIAVRTVLEIADDATAEKKDRLKAAEMILNRTGLHATTEHKVAVTHRTETDKEAVKRITELAGKLGLDPQKLLGAATIDADFVELPAGGAEENSEDDLSDLF